MEDQEKKDGRNSIRVVDDAPKDVVRLDTPKKVRIERKGEAAVARVEAKHRDKVESAPESAQFNPEEEWLVEAAEKDVRAVPMGWFALLGVGLLAVVAWAGFQVISADSKPLKGSPVSESNSDLSGSDEPLGKLANESAEQDAAEHFEKTEKVLRGFLGAANPEERAKYVRHPDRVIPLMEDFYSRNEFKKINYVKIDEYRIFPLENLPFLALKVEDEEGTDHAILLEDGPDGIVVDWESFVCFQPISIDKYARERPSGSISLRAYVTPDYFHSYEFESREKYSSFRLRFRGSEVLLNGYVERGSELDQKFRKLFPNEESAELKPLIVTVRFLEGGRALRSVLIEGLESRIWAYAHDPAKVAPSEE